MPQKRSLADRRGSSLEDAPFMVMLSALVIVFVAVYGIMLLESFMEQQMMATAVDAAERIYNAGDMLSAGSTGSSRTIWVKVPEGYSVDFGGGRTNLRKNGEKIGDMGINNVEFKGETILAGKHHLKVEFSVDYFNNPEIIVSVIE